MLNNPEPSMYGFPNLGFLLKRMPYDLFKKIKIEVKNIEKDFTKHQNVSHRLSGNIQNEYNLIDCKQELQNYVIGLINEYDSQFQYIGTVDPLNGNVPLTMDMIWVNFQKKYEFNPNHNHSGIMSFVIWVEIPYDLTEELETSPGKNSIENMAGKFQFSYSDILGRMKSHQFSIDKSYEGMICLFPSKLTHCVYPFYTSDNHRISVSGNILLKVK
jgi:hypothetical protein